MESEQIMRSPDVIAVMLNVPSYWPLLDIPKASLLVVSRAIGPNGLAQTIWVPADQIFDDDPAAAHPELVPRIGVNGSPLIHSCPDAVVNVGVNLKSRNTVTRLPTLVYLATTLEFTTDRSPGVAHVTTGVQVPFS